MPRVAGGEVARESQRVVVQAGRVAEPVQEAPALGLLAAHLEVAEFGVW